MTTEARIKGRQVGIIGMARSGIAAAMLAKKLGGVPFVSDTSREELLWNRIKQLQEVDIPYETGGHTDRLLESDYIVISPGVPLQSEIVTRIRAKGIPVFSEIEFASWVCKGQIVAITGSNGKTTTTTLIGEMLTAGGYKTFVCGNIGEPFAGVADSIPAQGIAVVEISTFQLETIADFRPHIAMILNLSEDHLDRHGSFENYKAAKYRITDNQTADDYLILNLDDPILTSDHIRTKASRLFFSVHDKPEAYAFVKDDRLWIRKGTQETEIIKCSDILIPGPHNLQNASAAAIVASLLDVSPAVLHSVLSTFPGVEHRLERVGVVNGVTFINDSKATNVNSVCYALQSVQPPIYLILGGRDKGAPYEPLIQYGKGKIKGIVAIGEAREKIRNSLSRVFSVTFADSLVDAVQACYKMALPGETVLLSPACASFDMFENFEHRGRVFKDAVARLKNGTANKTVAS